MTSNRKTYLFERNNGEYITTDNTTPQRAYNHIIMKGYAKHEELLSCYHVAMIDGQFVRFGLNMINQLDK